MNSLELSKGCVWMHPDAVETARDAGAAAVWEQGDTWYIGRRGKTSMTIPNLLLTVLLAAIFAAMVLSYVKKLRRGENCCGTRNVKVKKKRLRKPAGTFMLEVEGMHCENCLRTVTEAVNGLEGYAAKVDILTKECRVSYENGPDIEEVIGRIRRAGFDAFVKEK